jgi:SAM-dependent methyltransferase
MTGLNARLARVKSILICPRCAGELVFGPAATCGRCGTVYPIRDGRIYFTEAPASTDSLDRLKGRLKRHLGRYYYRIGVTILAPTYPFNYRRWVRRHVNPDTQVVVDVGCGNHRIDEDVIGLDLVDYEAVDIVCDLRTLPFRPDSVDAFVSRGLLEHVPDPARVVAELARCTRPGGKGLHLIPFLFPFHASPHDFHRYTHKGLQLLFADWTIVDQTNPTGPVTLWLIATIELLSVLLSFGSERLRPYVYLLLCGVLFPLKFLDAPFVNRQSLLTLAPTIATVVRKGAGPAVA